MNSLLQELRYALRVLRKRPGFTAVAVITLALGIGANTTVFNSVNAMLLRPFPFPHLDRIVTIWETVPKQSDQLSPAPANFRDWSEQSTQFSQMAAVRGWDANLTGGNVAEHVEGSQVSADFFPLLGLSPELGWRCRWWRHWRCTSPRDGRWMSIPWWRYGTNNTRERK